MDNFQRKFFKLERKTMTISQINKILRNKDLFKRLILTSDSLVSCLQELPKKINIGADTDRQKLWTTAVQMLL